jgi:hypothetical protein
MIDNLGPALGIIIAVLVTALLWVLARLEPKGRPARDPSVGRHRGARGS